MAAIPNFGASNTSAVTNTNNASWSDVVSYTFADTDQVASATYAVFWQGAFSASVVTSDFQVQVLEGATARASITVEPKEVATPVDRDQQGGFFFFTAASTPASTTFKIQVKPEVNAVTATAHNGYLRIVKLPANSLWVESTSDEAFTSIADKSSASISATGEYLFLASAEVDANTTGATLYIRVDGTDYPLGATNSDPANYAGMIMAVKATATTAVKVRVLGNGGGTVNVRNVRLLALSSLDFNNLFFARMAADGAGVGTSYTNQLTMTQTVAAGDHLVIGSMVVNPNSATVSGYGRLTSGGTQIDEVIREGASTGAYGTIMRLETYTAGSRTWNLDAKSESGSLTLLRQGSSIAVIDLQERTGGTTAWKSPGTGAEKSYEGVQTWSGYGGPAITSSDDTYVTCTTAGTAAVSRHLRLTNFGFTTADLPLGATVNGIELEIERKATGTVTDTAIYLVKGTSDTTADHKGSNKSAGATWPGSDTYATFGGAADTWSSGLTSSDIRGSDFGVTLRVSLDVASVASIDHVRARVTWTAGAAGYTLDAVGSSFSMSGAAAGLKHGRKVTAASGAYSLIGTAATLSKAVPGLTLTASTGAYSFTGTSAGLKVARNLVAASGAYSLTGTAATLSEGYTGSLNALTLSASSVVENATDGTFIGNILGKTSGSTLSLVYTAGGRVKLGGSGESRTLTAGGASHHNVTPTFDVTIRETLGADVRDTTLPITVTDNPAYPSSPLWLYDSSVSEADFNFIHSTDPDAFDSVSYIGQSYQEMTGIGTGISISSGGTYEIKQRESFPSFVEGDTITGATSGATATVNTVSIESGDWPTGDASGDLTLTNVVGTFVLGENLNVGANLNVGTIAALNVSDLNIKQHVYLFRASFTDTSHTVDFHMDERYGGQAAAQVAVDKYTPRLGKLPKIIRENFLTIKGLMGDGTFNAESQAHFFTIYEDRADTRIANDDLEESFFHEAIHAALQSDSGGTGLAILGSTEWDNAVAADAKYITKYAASNSQEDFAESALFAYTLTLHPERFPEPDRTQIAGFIPNRIAFWQDVFGLDSVTLTADAGSFALTGTAAGLKAGRKLTAVAGSFALSGTAASFRRGYTLTAVGGSIALTGTAAGLRHTRILTAVVGSFSLTGATAGLRSGRKVAAASVSFTLSGQSANLGRGRKLTSASGAFALTGTAAGFKRGLKVGAASGTFALNGANVTLSYGDTSFYGLTAEAASFTLNGQVATLRRNRVLTSVAGSFGLTGSVASLRLARKMSSLPASYAVSGSSAGLGRRLTITGTFGAFSVATQAAAMRRTYGMPGLAGAFVWNGSAADLATGNPTIPRRFPTVSRPTLGISTRPRNISTGRR